MKVKKLMTIALSALLCAAISQGAYASAAYAEVPSQRAENEIMSAEMPTSEVAEEVIPAIAFLQRYPKNDVIRLVLGNLRVY